MFPGIQTPDYTWHRAGMGHILLKTGAWNAEENNLMKDLIVVGTTNVPLESDRFLTTTFCKTQDNLFNTSKLLLENMGEMGMK